MDDSSRGMDGLVAGPASPDVQRAVNLIMAGRWDEGEDACRDALRREPGSAVVREMLAGCLALRGSYDEALSEYELAVSCDPAYKVAWHNLGYWLERIGRIGDAEVAYRRAVSVPPYTSDSLHNLGNCLVNQGKWQQAIAAYREALTLDAGNKEIRWNLEQAVEHQRVASGETFCDETGQRSAAEHYRMGLSHHQRGEFESAGAEYRAALGQDPAHAFSRENLARVLIAAGAVSEAIREVHVLLEHYPRNASGHRLLSICCARLGQSRRATEELEKAIELDPEMSVDSSVPFLLGMIRIIRAGSGDAPPDQPAGTGA